MKESIERYLREICPSYDPVRGEVLGLLDSLSLVSLVTFLRNEWNLEIDLASFDISNFTHIDTMVDALTKLKRSA